MMTESPLKTFRLSAGLSLEHAAVELGVHKTTISRIEAGELPVDADMMERIFHLSGETITAADMYHVRLAWLRAHRPEKFRNAPSTVDAS